MSAQSTSALSAYLFQRIKADVDFLHSQSLLDNGARDAINLQLDAAAARNGSASSHSNVNALSGQLSSVSFASPSPQQPSPAPPSIHEHPQPPPQDNRERAKALWDYAATQPDDLSFRKGDEIVVVHRENDHWFRGFVSTDPSSRTGLFPSNHVQMVSGAPSYPSQPGPEAMKGAMQPYQHNVAAPQYYNGPQSNYYQPPPQHQMQQQPQYQAPVPAEPAKHSKFAPGTFKHTLATAAVGGAGFGAGSAIAGNIVNAIL